MLEPHRPCITESIACAVLRRREAPVGIAMGKPEPLELICAAPTACRGRETTRNP